MRLIDADALQREFDDAHKDEPDFFCCNFLNNAGNPSTEWDCVDEILENAPTVDARPVTHGEWNSESSYYMACSCCNYHLTRDEWFNECDWNFCPQCGAKMDGGKSDG